MTWTTSADPWANGIRRDVVRVPLFAHCKLLLSEAKPASAAVPALAATHLCLLALLIPALTEPGAIALLFLSGLVLLGAAVAALGSRRPNEAEAAFQTVANPPCQFVGGLSDGSMPLPNEPAPSRAAASVINVPPEARHHPLRANAHNKDWADLMARVSHELRTPLNAVLGFSDLMDRGTFGPLGHQRYQEYARHIHDSGRDLLKSAEDTLAVTSLLMAPSRHMPTEVVDLANLAADAWAFFGRLPQSKCVTLTADIPAGTEILCDRRNMRQALVNLLSEGLTRAQSGTTITLRTTLDHGQVGLHIALPFMAGQVRREPGSLDVCLARTLLEFHGATLVEHLSEQSGWCVSTSLERADQADFFTIRTSADEPRHVLA